MMELYLPNKSEFRGLENIGVKRDILLRGVQFVGRLSFSVRSSNLACDVFFSEEKKDDCQYRSIV